jgi:hypothetical protein
MARVNPGPFFILLFSILGTLQGLHSEENSSPEAFASADQKHLYLWLNRSDLPSTGAWMAFLDLGLGKGAKSGEGGLKSVDLRYEQGRLFRHTPGFEETWTPAGSPMPLKWDSWQVLRIPIPHMVPNHALLKWRIALFPHDRQEPLFLPRNHVGEVDSGRRLEFSPKRENPFHLFHSLMRGQAKQKLPRQSFTPTKEPMTSPLKIQELWPEELMISLKKGTQNNLEEQINRAFSLLQVQSFPLILDPGENQLPMGELMSAAQLACSFSKRPFAPVVRSEADLPVHPTTLILSWKGPLKERVIFLEKLRHDLPEAKLFISVGNDFLNIDRETRELALRSWHRFNARPLLSRGIDLRVTQPALWLPFLWQNFLLESETEWREMPPQLPTPPGKILFSPQKRIEMQWQHWKDDSGKTQE